MYENLQSEMDCLKKALITGLAALVLLGWLFTVASGCGTINGIGTDVRDGSVWLKNRINHGWKVDD